MVIRGGGGGGGGGVINNSLRNVNDHTFCKTLENSNFLKNGKIVISVQIQNFSRSRMMKQISLLESSCEI